MALIPTDAVRYRTELWPQATDFDLPAMREAGWDSTPLTEFVVKVASRCNLHCDYCYVYELADQSWRGQPKRMSLDTVRLLAERIREHSQHWGFRRVVVSFHGGEPLLAGAAFLDQAATVLRDEVGPYVQVRLVCQTNATLVDADIAEVFRRHDVRVGVSLDGDRVSNDRHRLYRDGSSSFDDVQRGVDLLREAGPDVLSGVLATIDLENDPLDVYRTLVGLGAPGVDFLLPHGNWETPPPGVVPGDGRTPYADWLLKIFEVWYEETAGRPVVRIFEDAMNLIVGGSHSFELYGMDPISLLTIETDGSIELVDTLKSSFEGAAVTERHLRDTSLDEVLSHPGVVARQIGAEALAEKCRSCDVVGICGGGMYTHRFSRTNGFRTPSVYCDDLKKLIGRIEERVTGDIAAILEGSQ